MDCLEAVLVTGDWGTRIDELTWSLDEVKKLFRQWNESPTAHEATPEFLKEALRDEPRFVGKKVFALRKDLEPHINAVVWASCLKDFPMSAKCV